MPCKANSSTADTSTRVIFLCTLTWKVPRQWWSRTELVVPKRQFPHLPSLKPETFVSRLRRRGIPRPSCPHGGHMLIRCQRLRIMEVVFYPLDLSRSRERRISWPHRSLFLDLLSCSKSAKRAVLRTTSS